MNEEQNGMILDNLKSLGQSASDGQQKAQDWQSTTFLEKIDKNSLSNFDLTENKQYNNIICWLPKQNGFQILNLSKFTQSVLPQHFHHNNISSFIRQVNLYGFIRPKQSEQYVYQHESFLRNKHKQIRSIKRKTLHKSEQPVIKLDSNNVPTFEQGQPQASFYKILQMVHALIKQNEQLRKQNIELALKSKRLMQKGDGGFQNQRMKQSLSQKQTFNSQRQVKMEQNQEGGVYHFRKYFDKSTNPKNNE